MVIDSHEELEIMTEMTGQNFDRNIRSEIMTEMTGQNYDRNVRSEIMTEMTRQNYDSNVKSEFMPMLPIPFNPQSNYGFNLIKYISPKHLCRIFDYG